MAFGSSRGLAVARETPQIFFAEKRHQRQTRVYILSTMRDYNSQRTMMANLLMTKYGNCGLTEDRRSGEFGVDNIRVLVPISYAYPHLYYINQLPEKIRRKNRKNSPS